MSIDRRSFLRVSSAPLALAAGWRLARAIPLIARSVHPMHLHGHFFRLVNARGLSGLNDTVLVDPMGRRDVVFQADHAGRWMFHCHHAYHMEAGMARIVEYA